jgi:hypothetical protein
MTSFVAASAAPLESGDALVQAPAISSAACAIKINLDVFILTTSQ